MSSSAHVRLSLAGLVGVVALSTSVRFTDRPDNPQLQISPERLSYRLTQREGYYVVTMVVRLANESRDTVYLTTQCGHGRTLYRQWESLSSRSDLMVPGHLEACLLAGGQNGGPLDGTVAIPPDQSRRDTIRVDAKPFAGRGDSAMREGVFRFRVRYTPLVRRGFLRKKWTTDPHVWLSSDPFELLTPGFER